MRQLNLSTPAGITELWVNGYDDAKRKIPMTCVLLDRWVVQIDNGDPSTGTIHMELGANGWYSPLSRQPMPPDNVQMEALPMEWKQVPYFGAAFADFAIVDGTAGLLDQIQAWGDTHVMHFCGDNDTGYNENGQPYGVDQIVKPCNSWANMPFYIECADAIIARGLKPMYTLDGEGGPDWLKANFASWVEAMRTGYDRLRFGPVTVAFDGVWPAAWTPQQMMDMIPWMRDVLGPDAYLGFWYGNGPSGNPYLWVNDENDYTQPWCDGLDIVLTTSGPDEALGVSMANKAQYMVRDPNFSEFQPTFHGPFVFHDNSRGPRYWGNVEFLTYQTVRDPNQVYKAPSETQRQQMRTMNVPCAG